MEETKPSILLNCVQLKCYCAYIYILDKKTDIFIHCGSHHCWKDQHLFASKHKHTGMP